MLARLSQENVDFKMHSSNSAEYLCAGELLAAFHLLCTKNNPSGRDSGLDIVLRWRSSGSQRPTMQFMLWGALTIGA